MSSTCGRGGRVLRRILMDQTRITSRIERNCSLQNRLVVTFFGMRNILLFLIIISVCIRTMMQNRRTLPKPQSVFRTSMFFGLNQSCCCVRRVGCCYGRFGDGWKHPEIALNRGIALPGEPWLCITSWVDIKCTAIRFFRQNIIRIGKLFSWNTRDSNWISAVLTSLKPYLILI